MKQIPFILLVAALASLSAVVQLGKYGDTFLPGDCLFYAQTAVSLLHDGDFDLSNQLNVTTREDLRPYEGFFAVSTQDLVVPKHSTLLPIVSVPFVAAFNIYGFLIVNVLIAVALVVGVAHLAGNSTAAKVTAIALFATSSWLGYCFNYSPDLFAAALITWAYAMARTERWLLLGLFAGLAVWAKVYAVIILLPLAIVVLPAGWRPTLRAVLGTLPGLVPMLAINALLYGGPFVTGYDRDATVTATGFKVRDHYSLFDQPFLPGLVRVLFDPNVGMVRTAPLWFLWPLGFVLAWPMCTPFPRRFAVALAFGAMANVLFFAPYKEWDASIGGNRFLFPAVALGGALLVPIALRLNRRPELAQ